MNFQNSSFYLLLLALSILCYSCTKDPSTSESSPSTWEDLFESSDPFQVTLNPSGIASLSASVEFKTKSECEVEIIVDGEIPVRHKFSDRNIDHSIPVLGLYGDKNNRVIINLTSTNGTYDSDTFFVKTDPLPIDLPSIIIDVNDLSNSEPGMNYISLAINNGMVAKERPMVFDKNGDVRWMLDLSAFVGLCHPQERNEAGNILFTNQEHIYEYDMLGNEVRTIHLPGFGFHHDIIQLPNKNFIVAASKDGRTIMTSAGIKYSKWDVIVELDYNSGALVTEWDMREVLDCDRFLVGPPKGDWLHINSMCYDETDNTLIVSGRNHGIFKVDWQNNLKWLMASDSAWGKAGPNGNGHDIKPFLLKAVNSNNVEYSKDIQMGKYAHPDFDWSWGMHAPLILKNGNLLVFDNGWYRFYDINAPGYSRAVEYKINETSMTVQQIREYGFGRGTQTYSSMLSDVDELEQTGNRLFVPGLIFSPNGTLGKVIEYNAFSNREVFEATINFKNKGSVFGEFDMIYRAERIKLYN